MQYSLHAAAHLSPTKDVDSNDLLQEWAKAVEVRTGTGHVDSSNGRPLPILV